MRWRNVGTERTTERERERERESMKTERKEGINGRTDTEKEGREER